MNKTILDTVSQILFLPCLLGYWFLTEYALSGQHSLAAQIMICLPFSLAFATICFLYTITFPKRNQQENSQTTANRLPIKRLVIIYCLGWALCIAAIYFLDSANQVDTRIVLTRLFLCTTIFIYLAYPLFLGKSKEPSKVNQFILLWFVLFQFTLFFELFN